MGAVNAKNESWPEPDLDDDLNVELSEFDADDDLEEELRELDADDDRDTELDVKVALADDDLVAALLDTLRILELNEELRVDKELELALESESTKS